MKLFLLQLKQLFRLSNNCISVITKKLDTSLYLLYKKTQHSLIYKDLTTNLTVKFIK